MADEGVAIEVELKLALDPAAARPLLRHPAVRALRRGRLRRARLVGTYYDTADGLLASEGVALRVRRTGRRWVQALKGPPEPGAGAGLGARAELEWPLARPVLDVARLAATPWRKLFARAERRGGLLPRFSTDFERLTLPLRFPDGTLALLCVDRGEIRAARAGRTQRLPIAEIEIELESGATANLFALALALASDLPVAVMTASKAGRGHALASGERDRVGAPVRARSVRIAGSASAGEALALLGRECLDQIAANAAGLVQDPDPEWVHQMRIGTRRLRACLALMESLAPSAAVGHLRTEARWLARALGPARDWDVFVRETLPPLAAGCAGSPATAAAVKKLRARAQSRRRQAQSAARDAVGSARFQRLLLAGGLLCAASHLGAAEAGGTPPAALAMPARRFAAATLARRQRRLSNRGASLVRGSAAERHATRIAAKRLRYVAEFFAPLMPRKRGKAFLKALSALQDVLGQLNDLATALRLADSSGVAADAVLVLHGFVAARAAALEADLAAAWRRYAATEPFWPED
jgi:inorganic triphosphatase YgiF